MSIYLGVTIGSRGVAWCRVRVRVGGVPYAAPALLASPIKTGPPYFDLTFYTTRWVLHAVTTPFALYDREFKHIRV